MIKDKVKVIFYDDDLHSVPLEYIRLFRLSMGYKQSDIAYELGVSRESISSWENGFSDYNFHIQTWYIKHGLLKFNKLFKELMGEMRNG